MTRAIEVYELVPVGRVIDVMRKCIVTTKIPCIMREMIDEQAQKYGVTRSEIIRMALIEYLQRKSREEE